MAIKTPKPHYHGHRDRLRERFAKGGPDALADYELLELYLFNSIRMGDVKPIAKDLIAKFGSFAEAVAAPVERLVEVKGVGPKTALDLQIIKAAATKLGQESILGRPVLSSWTALLDYCRSAMQFEGKEQFRVLFLDRKNRLIADEVLGQGTIDRAPVYPREIIKRALAHESTALILTHNHPSGDPTPGFLFALFYTVIGLPIAWLADRYSRVNIVSTWLCLPYDRFSTRQSR